MSLSDWLDGKKTAIGAGLSLLNLVSPMIGVPPGTVAVIGAVANGIMGLGLAHKAVKAMSDDAPAPRVPGGLVALVTVTVLGLLTACAGLTTPQAKTDETKFRDDAVQLETDVSALRAALAPAAASLPEVQNFLSAIDTHDYVNAAFMLPALGGQAVALGQAAAPSLTAIRNDLRALAADSKKLLDDARSKAGPVAAK